MLEYLEDIIGSNQFKEPIEEMAKTVEQLNEERGEKVDFPESEGKKIAITCTCMWLSPVQALNSQGYYYCAIPGRQPIGVIWALCNKVRHQVFASDRPFLNFTDNKSAISPCLSGFVSRDIAAK